MVWKSRSAHWAPKWASKSPAGNSSALMAEVAIHNESYRLLLLFSASVALLVGLATANLPRLEEDKQNRVEGAWFMFNFQCLERNTEEALILLQKHGLLCGDRMVL